MPPIIELFSSLECPYAYLLNYRLRQIMPEYSGRLEIRWRALALEFVNNVGNSRSNFDEEREVFMRLEPRLRIKPWIRPAWDWPVTLWLAFEALACAQAQSSLAAFEMSWALRFAFFSEGRNISLRHEIFIVANQVARLTRMDIDLFCADWDSGKYKQSVIDDSIRGWQTLKVKGSATLLLPDYSQVTNPGIHAPEEQSLSVLRTVLERCL